MQWAHIGNNFTLTSRIPAQRDVQPRFDITTGVWARSFNESIFVRPTHSVDVTTSYFLPATLGGDHAFKVGYRWRTARGESISHTGGNAVARYTNVASANRRAQARARRDGSCNADLFRDGYTELQPEHARALRAGHLHGEAPDAEPRRALGSRRPTKRCRRSVPANPLIPQIMPAIDFPGVDAGVVWNDISPRLGMTYDITGNGKSVARASYSMYYGQMAPGQLAGKLISIGQVIVRYPWADLNGDTFVQANELNLTNFAPFLTKSAAFDPANPTSFLSPGDDRSERQERSHARVHRRAAAGTDAQPRASRSTTCGASTISSPGPTALNWDSTNFQAFTLDADQLRADGELRAGHLLPRRRRRSRRRTSTRNQPDRYRDYNGVEFALTKRYSDRWAANVSFAWNNAIDNWDSLAGIEDPTNIENLNGASFAPESAGSGVDNVFNNAEWLFKASGQYTTPLWDISIAGSASVTQGYPFPQQIAITSRGNGVADDKRLPVPARRRPPAEPVRRGLPRRQGVQLRRHAHHPEHGHLQPDQLERDPLAPPDAVLVQRDQRGVGSSSTTLPPNNISSIIAPRVIRFGAQGHLVDTRNAEC